MSENQIFVTVTGVDKVGIVAKVATALALLEVNIEDIKQTLMQGHFVMFMLCDTSESKMNFKEIKNAINFMFDYGIDRAMGVYNAVGSSKDK